MKASGPRSSGKRWVTGGAKIHLSALHEGDRSRVDVLHAARQDERETLAAGGRGLEGRALLGRYAGEDDACARPHRLDRRVDRRVLAGRLDRHVEPGAARGLADRSRLAPALGGEHLGPEAARGFQAVGPLGEVGGEEPGGPGEPRHLEREETDRAAAEDADAGSRADVGEVDGVERDRRAARAWPRRPR